jgi:hypothetical protein
MREGGLQVGVFVALVLAAAEASRSDTGPPAEGNRVARAVTPIRETGDPGGVSSLHPQGNPGTG